MSVKYDQNKPRAGLVLLDFRRALLEVAKLGTYGITKYEPGGWVHVPDGYSRYTDALCRHLLAPEKLDESGFYHDTHVAWNALARLEILLRSKNDDFQINGD